MSTIYTITFHDQGQDLIKQLCLYDDVSPKDIRSFISASFNDGGRDLIGVYDDQKGVYFPLSMIAANMSMFTSGIFTLIYRTDDISLITATADARKRSAKAFDFISAAMKVPLEFTDAFVDIIVAEVRSQTSIHSFKIGMILQAVSHFSGASNEIGKSKFIASMRYLTLSSDRTPDLAANDQAAYERIFDCLARGTSQVNVFRLCRFLALFCGGIPNENVKMLYFLFDFDRDGIVSAGDVFNCFRDLLGSLGALYEEIFAVAAACRLDDVAKLLTISVFRAADAPASALSLDSFYAWLSSRYSEDGDEHILTSAHLLVDLSITETTGSREHLIDITTVEEARSILSLQDIAPSTLKECIANYADTTNPQFVSRRGVFCAVLLASRVHNIDVFGHSHDMDIATRMDKLLQMEVLLLQLFALFDPLKSGFVDKDDLFCGLCAFCGGSWVDRVAAIFTSSVMRHRPVLDSLDTHLQLLVTREDMSECLVSVLKAILLFSEYSLHEAAVQRLTGRMLEDAFHAGTFPVQSVEGHVSAINFANWIESTVDSGTTGRKESKNLPPAGPAPSAPPLNTLTTLTEELRHVKYSLGFVGFSAEDVMEHMGECAHAGYVTLSGWLQIVRHMRQLETDFTSSEKAMELARLIFVSVAGLHTPVFSPGRELAVSYGHLLAAVSILCDSPPEDKIAVAFMVLASTEEELGESDPSSGTRYVTYENLVNYFRGVLTVTNVCSPLAQEQTRRADVSVDELAVAGVNHSILTAGLSPDIDNFDQDEFSAVAWSCVDE